MGRGRERRASMASLLSLLVSGDSRLEKSRVELACRGNFGVGDSESVGGEGDGDSEDD